MKVATGGDQSSPLRPYLTPKVISQGRKLSSTAL